MTICQGSEQLPHLQPSGEEWVVRRRLCASESVTSLLKRLTLCVSERTFPITYVAAKKTPKNGIGGPGRSHWSCWSPCLEITVSEIQSFKFTQGQSDTKQLIWDQSISFRLGRDLSRDQNRESGRPTSAMVHVHHLFPARQQSRGWAKAGAAPVGRAVGALASGAPRTRLVT